MKFAAMKSTALLGLIMAAVAAAQLSLDARGYFRNGTRLFIPVGVNYWPASTGCNLWSAEHFPADEIQHDLDVLERSPFNTVRFFVTWGELEPEEGVYDEKKFADLASMLRRDTR